MPDRVHRHPHPGADRKENFSIIGAGVSESADQHVHLRETPGFNVGAAGQPPHCRNSLHSHRTAEAFFVHRGRWRFFWGRRGTAGEVVLEVALVPGVIDSTNNFVEHPELVAQRIEQFTRIVGPERVIAGTDCGFGTFAGFGSVDPDIAYVKLAALAEGAAIASARL